jgi:hypothetical protein
MIGRDDTLRDRIGQSYPMSREMRRPRATQTGTELPGNARCRTSSGVGEEITRTRRTMSGKDSSPEDRTQTARSRRAGVRDNSHSLTRCEEQGCRRCPKQEQSGHGSNEGERGRGGQARGDGTDIQDRWQCKTSARTVAGWTAGGVREQRMLVSCRVAASGINSGQ